MNCMLLPLSDLPEKKISRTNILLIISGYFHVPCILFQILMHLKKKKMKSPTYLPMSKLVFGANFSSLHFLNLQDWYNRFMGKKCFLINHVCNLHLVKFVCTKGPTIYLLGGRCNVFSHEPEKKFIQSKILDLFLHEKLVIYFSSSSCWVRLFFIYFFFFLYIFQF